MATPTMPGRTGGRPRRDRGPGLKGHLLRRRLLVGPGAFVAVLSLATILSTALPSQGQAEPDRLLRRAEPSGRVTAASKSVTEAQADQPTTTSTTAAPTTTTTEPPTTTTTAPPARFTLDAYRGLGAWLDVYDWSSSFAKYGPAVELDAIDQLAAQGVQTLFIQASKWDAPEDVVDPPRLLSFIDKAHQVGIDVVGWYLPTLEDPTRDLQRLLAIAALPVDGLAVDIEARNVGDVAERNRRLVDLSTALRGALPGEVIGAIPLEPVLLEDVNPSYWPGFPWAALAPSYDVWLPMAYWTNRKPSSIWRDAYTYTMGNIDRVRALIGQPGAPVHPVGGIGDKTSVADLQGFRAAALARGAIGGSIYDFRTTAAPHWPELLPFRDLRP